MDRPASPNKEAIALLHQLVPLLAKLFGPILQLLKPRPKSSVRITIDGDEDRNLEIRIRSGHRPGSPKKPCHDQEQALSKR